MEVFLGCAVIELSDRSWHVCELQMAPELHSCWVRERKSSEMQLQPYKPELCPNPALESDRAVWIYAMDFKNQNSPLPWVPVLSRNVYNASCEGNSSCKWESVSVEWIVLEPPFPHVKHEGYLLLRNNPLHFYNPVCALFWTEVWLQWNTISLCFRNNYFYSENIFLSFICLEQVRRGQSKSHSSF